MPTKAPRVFFEIGIGDEDKNVGEQANWSLTKNFLQSKAQQVITVPLCSCYASINLELLPPWTQYPDLRCNCNTSAAGPPTADRGVR